MMRHLPILLFALIAFILSSNVNFVQADESIGCLDEDGKPVDWYYLYKLPGHFGEKHKSKGERYMYLTSASPNNEWQESAKKIGDADSFAGRTVSQAYFDRTKIERLLIAYNDEPPNKKGNSKRGHTKGLVVANQNTGFWLIHSVPLFPNITDDPHNFSYPETGKTYGQSFLCLSLAADQINTVGKQLLYNEPDTYETNVPTALNELYANFVLLINQQTIKVAPFWNQETVNTRGNVAFDVFAKTGKFEKDLYEDWVAPTFNADLYVETWIHGPGVLPSNCTRKNHVWNVSQVKINNDMEFATTDDHSKWGVSDEKSNWICVGDINRAQHQKQRGGGTVCQRSSAIAARYRALIGAYEPCNK